MTRDAIARAERLTEAGEHHAALEQWREITARDEHWVHLCQLGWAAKQCSSNAEAIDAFRKAASLAPDNAHPLIGLGILLTGQGRFEEAEKCLVNPVCRDNAAALCVLGYAQFSIGKYAEAEAVLRHSIGLDPSKEEAHFNLGLVLRHLRSDDEAEERFRRAIAIDPDYAAAHRELGFVLDRRRDPEAGHHLREALELDPGNPWAHVYWGVHIEKQGQVEPALIEYEAAARLAPDLAIPVFFQGLVHESLGNLTLARERIQRAAELEPFDPQFEKYLGVFDRRHGARCTEESPRHHRSGAARDPGGES